MCEDWLGLGRRTVGIEGHAAAADKLRGTTGLLEGSSSSVSATRWPEHLPIIARRLELEKGRTVTKSSLGFPSDWPSFRIPSLCAPRKRAGSRHTSLRFRVHHPSHSPALFEGPCVTSRLSLSQPSRQRGWDSRSLPIVPPFFLPLIPHAPPLPLRSFSETAFTFSFKRLVRPMTNGWASSGGPVCQCPAGKGGATGADL